MSNEPVRLDDPNWAKKLVNQARVDAPVDRSRNERPIRRPVRGER